MRRNTGSAYKKARIRALERDLADRDAEIARMREEARRREAASAVEPGEAAHRLVELEAEAATLRAQVEQLDKLRARDRTEIKNLKMKVRKILKDMGRPEPLSDSVLSTVKKFVAYLGNPNMHERRTA